MVTRNSNFYFFLIFLNLFKVQIFLFLVQQITKGHHVITNHTDTSALSYLKRIFKISSRAALQENTLCKTTKMDVEVNINFFTQLSLSENIQNVYNTYCCQNGHNFQKVNYLKTKKY